MAILWLAILLYSVGLGLVLHFRPSLMFTPNGTWKEFGYQRDARHTMFPFWLFTIVWAFVSYALAAAVSAMYPSPDATAAVASASWLSTMMSPSPSSSEEMVYFDEDSDDVEEEEEGVPISSAPELMPEVTLRRPRGRPRKTPYPSQPQPQPRQGYYVLDPNTRDEGLHRYIYYGPNAPLTS